MRFKICVALVVMLLFGGCGLFKLETKIDAKEVVSKLQYAKDTRTGLCFAVSESVMTNYSWQPASITNVPCASVEQVLK